MMVIDCWSRSFE